jgi:hypothetical protein
MAESGLDLYDIAEGTRGVVVNSGEDTWLQEMRSSLQQLDQMAYGPRRRPFRIELRRTAAPAQASAAAALSGPRNQ